MRNNIFSILKQGIIICLFSFSLGFSAQREVMAWVSACDIDDSRASLQMYYGIKEAITIIGLQWWLPNGSGGLVYSDDWDPTDTSVSHPSDTTVAWFRKFADEQGVKLYMCIFNCRKTTWDWSLAQSAFSAANRSKTVAAIVAAVEKLKLDGVDIDLESASVESGDKSAFGSLVSDLSTALHAKGKKLSVCTFASDNGGSPGLTWPTAWSDKVDHIMCMAYEWAGVAGTLTYESIYQGAGSPSGKFCVGVNADGAQSQFWQNKSAIDNVKGIVAMGSKVGMCIWTSAVKGGGVWQDTPLWDEIKKVSAKTITVDTVKPSPNLAMALEYTGSADTKNSTATVSKVNAVVTGKLVQKGSIDDGYFANFKGVYKGNFKDVKWIKVSYTSNNPFTIQLYQEEFEESGECFQNYVLSASSYRTVVLNCNTFYQPWWGNKVDNLDMSKVTGILFDPLLSAGAGGSTTITIKEIVCYGRTDWVNIITDNPTVSRSNERDGVVFTNHGQALSFTVAAAGAYTIALYRSNGSLVRSVDLGKIQQGKNTVSTLLNGLSKGMYHVQLTGATGTNTGKLIIK